MFNFITQLFKVKERDNSGDDDYTNFDDDEYSNLTRVGGSANGVNNGRGRREQRERQPQREKEQKEANVKDPSLIQKLPLIIFYKIISSHELLDVDRICMMLTCRQFYDMRHTITLQNLSLYYDFIFDKKDGGFGEGVANPSNPLQPLNNKLVEEDKKFIKEYVNYKLSHFKSSLQLAIINNESIQKEKEKENENQLIINNNNKPIKYISTFTTISQFDNLVNVILSSPFNESLLLESNQSILRLELSREFNQQPLVGFTLPQHLETLVMGNHIDQPNAEFNHIFPPNGGFFPETLHTLQLGRTKSQPIQSLSSLPVNLIYLTLPFVPLPIPNNLYYLSCQSEEYQIIDKEYNNQNNQNNNITTLKWLQLKEIKDGLVIPSSVERLDILGYHDFSSPNYQFPNGLLRMMVRQSGGKFNERLTSFQSNHFPSSVKLLDISQYQLFHGEYLFELMIHTTPKRLARCKTNRDLFINCTHFSVVVKFKPKYTFYVRRLSKDHLLIYDHQRLRCGIINASLLETQLFSIMHPMKHLCDRASRMR